VGPTFEWDRRKDEGNRRKHGVAFTEAVTAFADSLSVTIGDPDHSEGEERFILLGRSNRGRLLVVTHTDRDECTRIISVREASRRERRQYEDA
jgi:uncharacterized DUF497 family protein